MKETVSVDVKPPYSVMLLGVPKSEAQGVIDRARSGTLSIRFFPSEHPWSQRIAWFCYGFFCAAMTALAILKWPT